MFILDDIVRWLQGRDASKDLIESQNLQVLPLPVLVCDKSLSILKANATFTHHFRMDEDHLQGKTVFQVLGPAIKIIEGGDADGREKQALKPNDMMEGANPKILAGNFSRIGERVFHLYTRKAPSIVLLVFEDITKQRRLDEMIRKSRRELLSVFDGIEDPMVMIDRDYRIQRINQAMLKVAGGGTYQSFIGKTCYYKLHGLRERCADCTAGKTFRTGVKTSRLSPLQKKTGSDEAVYQVINYPIRDSSGKPGSRKVTSVAESYRDITEVKRVEERLYESERNRVMEPLAAGIAHEIRNPLAIIRSSAQYCLGEVKENRDLSESLQTILKSADTANRVITDFLSFSRPHEYDFRVQPLKPILQEAIRLIHGRAKGQRVRIRCEIARQIPSLRIDKKRFLQALMNFFVNSLDVMPRGGKLSVKCQPIRAERSVELLIHDTGTGIPKEMVSRVFQPFFSTKRDGVGLGLPIAEGIIRSHGGRIRFRSWPSQGSEVRVEIPCGKN